MGAALKNLLSLGANFRKFGLCTEATSLGGFRVFGAQRQPRATARSSTQAPFARDCTNWSPASRAPLDIAFSAQITRASRWNFVLPSRRMRSTGCPRFRTTSSQRTRAPFQERSNVWTSRPTRSPSTNRVACVSKGMRSHWRSSAARTGDRMMHLLFLPAEYHSHSTYDAAALVKSFVDPPPAGESRPSRARGRGHSREARSCEACSRGSGNRRGDQTGGQRPWCP